MPADVSELEAYAQDIKRAGVRVRREQRKVVKETTSRVEQSARSHVPVRTGQLQSSIEGSVRGMKGTVTATARYATFVEYGTRLLNGRWTSSGRSPHPRIRCDDEGYSRA
jgi:HK97 gp10 family phage protein